MKKLLIVFTSIFFFFLVVSLVLPALLQVDRFRPEIVKALQKEVQAPIEIGKLQLSILPRIRITSDKLEIGSPENSSFPKLLEAEKFSVSTSLLSLIFTPKIKITLKDAKIRLVKNAEAANWELLQKKKRTPQNTTTSSSANTAPSKPKASLSKTPNKTPSKDPLEKLSPFWRKKAEAARISLLLKKTELSYKDLIKNRTHNLSRIDFTLKDIGLNTKSHLNLEVIANSTWDKNRIQGPLKLHGKIQTIKKGEQYEVQNDLFLELKNLHIGMGTSFEKLAGVPLSVELKSEILKYRYLDFTAQPLIINFSDFEIEGRAKLNKLGSPEALIDLDISSDRQDIRNLQESIQWVKEQELRGALKIHAKLNGSLSNPEMDIRTQLKNGKGRLGNSGSKIHELSFESKISGKKNKPQIELKPLVFKSDESDLKIQLTQNKDSKAYFFKLRSENLNLNEFLEGSEELPQKKIETEDNTETKQEASLPKKSSRKPASKSLKKKQALDESLNALAPSLEDLFAKTFWSTAFINADLEIQKMQFLSAIYKKFKLNMNLKNRRLTIRPSKLQAYGGLINFTGKGHLKKQAPELSFSSEIKELKIQEVLQAHAPDWEKSLGGKTRGSFALSFKGLRKEQIHKDLTGDMNLIIQEGFTDMPVGNILDDVLKKVPQGLKSSLRKKNERLDGKFKSMNLKAHIAQRQARIDNIDVHFEPEWKGYGDYKFKGKGLVDFDRKVKMKGVVYLDPKVVKWPEAKGSSGDVEIPLSFKGPLDKPKPDIDYTIKKLSSRVTKNILNKETKKGTEKLLKEGGKALKKLFNF